MLRYVNQTFMTVAPMSSSMNCASRTISVSAAASAVWRRPSSLVYPSPPCPPAASCQRALFTLSRQDKSDCRRAAVTRSSITHTVRPPLPSPVPIRFVSGRGGLPGGFPGGFPGGGPGGFQPVAHWKIAAVLGGIAIAFVGTVTFIAGLAGPYVIGGVAVWLCYRTFSKWKQGYDAAGGAANPNNPFKRGPFTPEARAAAAVLKQQQRIQSIFSQFSPGMQSAFRGAGMGNMAGAGGPAAAANDPTMNKFLVHKLRATLLQQALRHSSLQHLSPSASGLKVRTKSLRSVVRNEAPISRNGVTLSVEEVCEVLGGDNSVQGVLSARYVLRLTEEQLKEISEELNAWTAQHTQTAQFSTAFSIADPSPFDGVHFAHVEFQQATWSPRQGHGRTVDLLSEFKQGRAKSGAPIIQEAEFEERK